MAITLRTKRYLWASAAAVALACTTVLALGVLSTPTPSHMLLSSPAFKNDGTIPAQYTCDGDGVSPPLIVKDIPPDAKTLALLMEDPDAPNGTFDHWIAYNIDATTAVIEEGKEPAGAAGKNSAGKTGYVGPCPPSGVHHYVFTVYALDGLLPLMEGASKKDIIDAMAGHIVDRAKLIGLYPNKPR